MVSPQKAAVRPRVISLPSGEALLLEEEVRSFLEAGACGAIRLDGPPGSGKTTALQHLAAVLPSEGQVCLLDGPTAQQVLDGLARRLVVYTPGPVGQELPGPFLLASYELAPWGEDDLIEYLLAVHKERCASVLHRLRGAEGSNFLRGIPGLWRIVLEQMADHESISSPRVALYRHLEELLPDVDVRERTHSACITALVLAGIGADKPLEYLRTEGIGEQVLRVLRHPAVQLLLATDRVLADLRGDADCDYLARRLPVELVQAVGNAVFGDTRRLERLHALLAGPPWGQAMAASILHAARTGWRPEAGCVPLLEGAYLSGAAWAGVNLFQANIREADLSGADLTGANLDQAYAQKARLRRVRLSEASLNAMDAEGADLACADLSSVRGSEALFSGANLLGANLEGAMLKAATFDEALLTGAQLVGADLSLATLRGARIKGADFTGANLQEACLSGLSLREACFRGACLAGANLSGCDLEGMDLPGGDFARANLKEALLTGTNMPEANFTGALLRGAKLAEVNWASASLRGADLRGATFHMGSTRSGLLFSYIASEGTRTGFYTDDGEEQHFKAAEEIRKANLCGADLRGARIDDVDFYLVDLRGAAYDPRQEVHFRRCRAILE